MTIGSIGFSILPGSRVITDLPEIDDPVINQLAEYTRMYLRDYPELNRLTEGYDHSPRHIRWAIIDTLSDWAATPPFIGQNLQLIVYRNLQGLFCRGVAINLLESLGILHMRNHLAYSDGGVNVQTENPEMIQSWLRMMKSEYEMKKQRLLIALNIESALSPTASGLQSEYYFINCVARDTPTITKDGVFPIQDLVGKTVVVLSKDGVYRSATFGSYGVQKLWEVKLSQGESFFATSTHKWPIAVPNGEDRKVYTTDLLDEHLIKNTVRGNGGTIRVESVQSTDRIEEVYCCMEPETHTFTIGSGVLTGNSFFGYL